VVVFDGQSQDVSGASYGAQWTLFRQAMEPGLERKGWTNQNVWMGHAAVTSANEHLFSETLARGGIGQAGVSAKPFRAWIDDWYFATLDDSPGAGLSRLRVSASGLNFRYTLNLTTDKPLVLHGEEGFSRKSERGQASYYYSQSFFTVEGVQSETARNFSRLFNESGYPFKTLKSVTHFNVCNKSVTFVKIVRHIRRLACVVK
jgi:predicted secreted hydrolase